MIYPRLLTGFGMLVFFVNLNFLEFWFRYLALSSFLNNRWLQVDLDGTSSQQYPVNAGVPQSSIVGPTLFLLCIYDLPDDVICNITV